MKAMKNRIFIMLCICIMLCCSACSQPRLTLSEENIEIEVGHTYTLSAHISDSEETIEWKMEDPSVALVDNGRVTALKEGKTRIVVSAADRKAYCDVVVISEKTRTETNVGTVVFETSNNCEVVLEELKDKDVKEVLCNGQNVLKSFDKKTGKLQIDSDIISPSPFSTTKQEISIYADTEKYTATTEIVTMVIDNEEELNQMSKMISKDEGRGCYILGCDIYCTGEYVSGNTVDFYGTFDGRGYSIYNMTISEKNGNASGLFGSSFSGVLCNVSFINALHQGTCGFIATETDGNIHDVYIQINMDEEFLGTATTVIGAETDTGLRISRVLIEYVTPLPEKIFGGYAVLDMHQGNESYQGLYVIGAERVMGIVATEGTGDIFGAYMTYDDFRADARDVSSWEGEFWGIINGIPVPKNL